MLNTAYTIPLKSATASSSSNGVKALKSGSSNFRSLLKGSLASQSQGASSSSSSASSPAGWSAISQDSPLFSIAPATQTTVTTPQVMRGNGVSYVHYGTYYDRSIHGPAPEIDYGSGAVQPGDTVKPVVTEPEGGFEYSVTKVGEIDRAPMAMFEYQGELLISSISRNDISETPIWSYSESDGIQKRGSLPEQVESGHTGYSYGDGFHLTPESWSGMVDYTASSPDGPWTKHDYTYLNPHPYKNLKWGTSYQDPVTGQQFMGFGNGDHPGVVISYNEEYGEWETFAADAEMRFPSVMGTITSGTNEDTTLIISNTYGSARLHSVNADGETELVRTFDDWSTATLDRNQRAVFVMSGDKVYWASFDDLNTWKECKYYKPEGQVESIEGIGEAMTHPKTGRLIMPAVDDEAGNTGFYEVSKEGDDMVLREVAWLGGVGEWAGKMAVVGDDLYYGSGISTGQEADLVPGAIYKIEVTNLSEQPVTATT